MTTLDPPTHFCTKCHTPRPVALFSFANKATGKLQSWCKPCKRAYSQNKYLTDLSSYRNTTTQKINTGRTKTPEYRARKYSEIKVRMREIQARKRTKFYPQYLPDLLAVYRSCPEGLQVDHIIPLISKVVCGLHVPWNLQYLTPEQNRDKGNKLLPL